MKLIRRESYLEKLHAFRGTPDIKIVTGVRRAGKSKALQAFRDDLLAEGGVNVIYLDLSDLANEKFKEYHALHETVLARLDPRKDNVLIVDEVQDCPSFELAVNSLHNRGEIDIYLTGSNAFLLSGDLATLFTGRQMEIQVFPFSFREFLDYFGQEGDLEEAFDRYVEIGGLAGSYPYRGDEGRLAYVREVFETILTRDLVQKYRIQEPTVLRRLAEYLMDNIANLTSPHKTSVQLAQNKVATNHVTASNYMDCLKRAFLFYPVKRYDIRGRKYLAVSEKYYLCDVSFRRAVLGRRNLDWGRVYENIVYLELLRRGYDVYVGKIYDLEVDFIALRGNEKMYVQVCDDLSRDETLAREVGPFGKIKDAYGRMIVARTRHAPFDREGVRIVNLADWLVAGEQSE